jgi:hypothetical protein
VVCLVLLSVLVLGEVPLEGVHPKEALLWEVVSLPCQEDVICSVFSGIQGDCKVTAKWMS